MTLPAQPEPPRETEAQLAERLGLPTLTRAAAYESLHTEAQSPRTPPSASAWPVRGGAANASH